MRRYPPDKACKSFRQSTKHSTLVLLTTFPCTTIRNNDDVYSLSFSWKHSATLSTMLTSVVWQHKEELVRMSFVETL